MAKKTVKPTTKKPTISKSKQKYPGQEKSITLRPKVKPDPEERDIDILGGDDDEDLEEGPKEERDENEMLLDSEGKPLDPMRHARVRYPSPKKNYVFKEQWYKLIDTVAGRENFQTFHLSQLETLCDLYVEYEVLTKFVRTHGYTYTAFGRQGKAIKTYPQVIQLNKINAEIRSYLKILGLLLVKDVSGKSNTEGNEWD